METGNRSDEAEAEPVAGSAATSFQPVEALEDMLTFIKGNSGPVIGDRNDATAIAPSDLHGHLAGFTAVFDGIIDEIGHRIEQEVPIARDQHSLITDSIDMPTFVLRRGIK